MEDYSTEGPIFTNTYKLYDYCSKGGSNLNDSEKQDYVQTIMTFYQHLRDIWNLSEGKRMLADRSLRALEECIFG